MADEKVAIVGGSGMLGSDVALLCGQRFDTAVFDLPDFDITNDRQLEEVVANASIVINCAAYTNVDKAESETDLAFAVNADAVSRFGAFARKAGIWVLHISTDFVFDGMSDRPYIETDQPNPLNAYGRSKLTGEQLLIESGCRYCIMRLEWTYGLRGSNFVMKLINRAKTDGKLKVVDDQTGSPTATVEAAKVICRLLAKKPEGIFHFASDGYVNRYEMARFIFDRVSMDVSLSRCSSSDFVTAAVRPLNSRFDCSKIKTLLDEPIEGWQEPLERFLRQL